MSDVVDAVQGEMDHARRGLPRPMEPMLPADVVARLDSIRDRQRPVRLAVEESPLGRFRAAREQAHAELVSDVDDAERLSQVLVLVLSGRDVEAREVLDALPADVVSAIGEAGGMLAELAQHAGAGRRS